MKKDTSRAFVKDIAVSASELKAENIKVLDLRNICSFTDYFVVCSGTSDRHVKSIADRIMRDQKEKKRRPLGFEGEGKGDWVLIDYGEVVAHVFHPEARAFYNIEKLWGDAKLVKIKDVTSG